MMLILGLTTRRPHLNLWLIQLEKSSIGKLKGTLTDFSALKSPTKYTFCPLKPPVLYFFGFAQIWQKVHFSSRPPKKQPPTLRKGRVSETELEGRFAQQISKTSPCYHRVSVFSPLFPYTYVWRSVHAPTQRNFGMRACPHTKKTAKVHKSNTTGCLMPIGALNPPPENRNSSPSAHHRSPDAWPNLYPQPSKKKKRKIAFS